MKLRTQALDDYGAFFIAGDVAAQRAQALQATVAVSAGRVILQARASRRQRRQHGVTVRNGLVAGHAQAAQNVARGTNADRVGWRHDDEFLNLHYDTEQRV